MCQSKPLPGMIQALEILIKNDSLCNEFCRVCNNSRAIWLPAILPFAAGLGCCQLSDRFMIYNQRLRLNQISMVKAMPINSSHTSG